MTKNAIVKKSLSETSGVLETTLRKLTAGLAGIAASKREEWILSLGHVFQRMRGREFLVQLLEEWNIYVKKGLIKEGYEGTEQHRVCLQELLDFLDKDSPDQVRFSTLKKIFLVAATEKSSSRDSVLPGQLMRLCRALSSGEVIVLEAVYRISKTDKWQHGQVRDARPWLNMVAAESGLTHPELVEMCETELIRKLLLTDRQYGDRSGVTMEPHFRLTGLAISLCRFVEAYENPPTAATGP